MVAESCRADAWSREGRTLANGANGTFRARTANRELRRISRNLDGRDTCALDGRGNDSLLVTSIIVDGVAILRICYRANSKGVALATYFV
jgi:hypothetical protein